MYIRSTGLENFQGNHFNIYCSAGRSETFFSSSPIRQREKWPRSRQWNINSVAETRDAEKVARIKRHMARRSWGKEHQERTLGRRGRDAAARTRGGERRRGIKLLGRRIQRSSWVCICKGSNIWIGQTLCFVSYYSRHSQYSLSPATGAKSRR